MYELKLRQQNFDLMLNSFEIGTTEFSERVGNAPETSSFSLEILQSQLKDYESQYSFNGVYVGLVINVNSENNNDISYDILNDVSGFKISKVNAMSKECKSCHEGYEGYKLEAKYNSIIPFIISILSVLLLFSLTLNYLRLKNSICSLSLVYKRDFFNKRTISKKVKVVALIDIDFFKKINDTLGHAEGDRAIKLLGSLLITSTSHNDLAFRWGGEEFLLLLKSKKIINSIEILERIRETVEKESLLADIPFTISIGYTDYNQDISWDEKLKKADDALYLSKSNGRNQVTKL